ncbi:hypothetical protein N657DRAFT_678656 [Parathielavia appendiculata]|uniref:Uncharacterized protein n=1 Tax=Parathielavia appendiculata TaxID=2587402 RepID=A0AAN6Z530_9PEZI|nr:hypothetical protein N657DRAFT_678656 [Parathielavia appendiculata]
MVNLRASSMLRVPGRYQEDFGPSRADRPIFAHPDVPFNVALVQHCAHPSLPLDHPGLGPSEAECARLAALATKETTAAEPESMGDETDSDESFDGEDEDDDYDGRQASASGRRGQTTGQAPSRPPRTGGQVGQGGQPFVPAPLDQPARAAYVAKVPRGAKPAGRSEGGGKGTTSAGNSNEWVEETAPANNQAARPNWANLSDGIKYAIIYDMTRTVPFSQAVQHLGLEYDEVMSLLALIEAERKKKKTYDALMQRRGAAEISSSDELLALAPVTEGITAREEGTNGDIHDVEIDEGGMDFVNDFNVSSGGELESSRTRRQMLNMTGPELILRLDPPPNSVNPRRLKGGGPSARAENLESLQASLSNGLHQENYEVKDQTTGPSAILDTLRRPSWESLRPVSNIPLANLTVFTARSFEFNFGEFISESDEETEWATERPDNMAQPTAALESLSLEDYLPMPRLEEPPNPVCFTYPTGQASDPYPHAPGNASVSPSDINFDIRMFANDTADSSEATVDRQAVDVGQQQSGCEIAATASELAPSQAAAEQEVTRTAFADEDCEMRDVSNQIPSRQASGPVNTEPNIVLSVEVHERIPAAQAVPSQADPSALALHAFLNAPAPTVRPLDPEIAMSTAEILAKYNRRVSFAGDNPVSSEPRRPTPVVRRQLLQGECVEDEISDEDNLPRYIPRLREPDDTEWKPANRRSGTRYPRSRAPGGRASGAGSSGATSSGARKRTCTESPSAEQAPKRARPTPAAPRHRSAAGDNTSPTPVKRGPGRPRKRPLPVATPKPPVKLPPASPTPASMTSFPLAGVPSGRPTRQAAVLQHLTSDTTQSSSNAMTDDAVAGMQAALSQLECPFTAARFAVRPSSFLATAPNEPENSEAGEQNGRSAPKTTQRRKREPELDEEGQPSKPKRIRIKIAPSPKVDKTVQAIEPKRRNRKAKADDDGNPVKPKRSRAAPKLDENGNPVTKKVNRRPPQYDENGNRVKLVRRKRNLDSQGRPIRCSTVKGTSFHVRPNVVMRSSEGEEMTRGEFDRAFKVHERRYLPGGVVGGGRYEIIETGVIWSFTTEYRNESGQEIANAGSGDEGDSQRQNDSQRSARAGSSRAGGVHSEYGAGTSQESFQLSAEMTDEDSSYEASADPGDMKINEPAPRNALTGPAEPQPAFGTPARNPSRLVLGLAPPNRSGQTRLSGFTRPNTPTHIALPPAAIGPLAVTVPMAPNVTATAGPTAASGSTRPRAPHQRATTRATGPTASDPRVAARVAELNERCSRYSVQTRDRFNSDQEFLDYAEGMLPLLYPNTGGGRYAPAKLYHDGSGGGGRRTGPSASIFGGQDSYI